MIELNLIPKEYRQQISRFQLIILTKNLVLWLVIYTILVAIVLLLARATLQRRFEVVVDQTTLVTQENHKIENSVRDFNKVITDAANLQAKELDWASFVVDFTATVPPGVTLTDVTLINGQRSTISGRAEQRDDLLSFKNNLEKLAEISKVDIPLENLQKRENVNFNIGLNFKLTRPSGYAKATQ
jgi:Tfp pilus assembly protein PilN